MVFSYGNSSQYTFATPQCAAYETQPFWHYFLLLYMPLMSGFSLIINGWIANLLVVDVEGRQLLQQPQHVYVLGCAVTNVGIAVGSFMLWIPVFLVPCIDVGAIFCLIKNFFNFSGTYQLMFNVCLICYDRWRMVRLGIKYNHAHEAERAKWSLCATSALSASLFVLPEFLVPAVTGLWRVPPDNDPCRCDPSQNQVVPQLHDLNVANVVAGLVVLIQWIVIVAFSTSTAWILFKNTAWKRKHVKIGPTAKSTVNSNSQTLVGRLPSSNLLAVNNAHKQLRATLIMFGLVIVTLVTNGPVTILLAWMQINPNIISGWWPVETLIILQLSTAAFDPFVFAITLPKLRARARKTRLGRGILWLLMRPAIIKTSTVTHVINNTVVPTAH